MDDSSQTKIRTELKITYFQRHPSPSAYSIERVFDDVRKALPGYIQPSVHVVRYQSRGIWRRLWNTFECINEQGDINHITGDIHYIASFLEKSRTIITIHDCVSLERLHGLRKSALLFFWYWLRLEVFCI